MESFNILFPWLFLSSQRFHSKLVNSLNINSKNYWVKQKNQHPLKEWFLVRTAILFHRKGHASQMSEPTLISAYNFKQYPTYRKSIKTFFILKLKVEKLFTLALQIICISFANSLYLRFLSWLMHLKEKFINITYLVTIHYVILSSLILPSIKTTSWIHYEGFVEITLDHN